MSLPDAGMIRMLPAPAPCFSITAEPSLRYRLISIAHAINHVLGIIKIVSNAVVEPEPALESILCLSTDHTPWLLDIILDLSTIIQRWAYCVPLGNHPHMALIQTVVAISRGYSTLDPSRAATATAQKAVATLAFLCAETAMTPGDIVVEGDAGVNNRVLFCKALLQVCGGASNSTAVSRIVMTRIVDLMDGLAEREILLGRDTDVGVSLGSLGDWRFMAVYIRPRPTAFQKLANKYTLQKCVHILRFFSSGAASRQPREPVQLTDPDLAQIVQHLKLFPDPNEVSTTTMALAAGVEPQVKRRKKIVADSMDAVAERLKKVLRIDEASSLASLEDKFL